MKMNAGIIGFLAVILLFTLSVQAAPPDWPMTHGIAMHGAPKYEAGFTHLDYTNPKAPKGGVLKRAEMGSFDSFNPHLLIGQPAKSMNGLSYWEPLMKRVWDEPFSIYGVVADQVAVAPDRSGITFYLNPKAVFHDGHPILAEDVVFTHNILKAHGRPNTRRIYKLVKDIVVHDDHTLTMYFGEGYDQETVLIIAKMIVMPKHYWEGTDDKGQIRDFSKTTLEPPLGSGPYKITNFEQGRQVTYERIKGFWAANHPVNIGHYNFDTIIFDYYRDQGIALQAFESGAFDLQREWSADKWARDYNFKAVETGEIIKGTFKHGRPGWARFFIYNTRKPIFEDVRLRKALGYAFDFEWVNKNLFNGAYERMNSIFANSDLAATDPVFILPKTDGSGPKGIRQNLKIAQDILKTAGWELMDGQMTQVSTGTPLTFKILLGNPSQERLALEFARNLKRLGVLVEVRTVDSAQYIRRLQDYDFDMTINHWKNSLSPGTEQGVYWCSSAADQIGGLNYAGAKNPKIDALVADLTTATTREGLVAATRALDRIIMESWYGIPLYYTGYDYVAYRSDLAHPEMSPLYGPVVETWWKKSKNIKTDDK